MQQISLCEFNGWEIEVYVEKLVCTLFNQLAVLAYSALLHIQVINLFSMSASHLFNLSSCRPTGFSASPLCLFCPVYWAKHSPQVETWTWILCPDIRPIQSTYSTTVIHPSCVMFCYSPFWLFHLTAHASFVKVFLLQAAIDYCVICHPKDRLPGPAQNADWLLLAP